MMSLEQELAQLKARLGDFFGFDNFTVELLKCGASVRRYYLMKLGKTSYFPRSEVVVMNVPLDRVEILDDYLNISYYLRRHGIARPRVYEIHRNQGWIFVEHGEGECLDIFLKKNRKVPLQKLYRQVIDFLLYFQEKARYESHCPAFHRFFDREKYDFEFQFHVKEQLLKRYFKYEMTEREEKYFEEFAREISHFLDIKLNLFVHRDFQSSNIFCKPKESDYTFQIIDFQDARSGNPVYDLVSILWDSYVDIPENLREELVEYYYQRQSFVRENFSQDQYRKWIDYSVVQRKLHDAGAFVYTLYLTENANFIQYIKGALEMSLDKIQLYPQFGAIEEMWQKIISQTKE